MSKRAPKKLRTVGDFRRFLALEEAEGERFLQSLGHDERKSYERWKRELQQLSAKIRAWLESPAAQEALELARRAEQGDFGAIQKILRESPIDVFREPAVVRHIESRIGSRKKQDGEFLEDVVKNFRLGLLAPRRGRPRRIDPSVAQLADAIQQCYENAPVTVKKSYRNPAARRMDVADLANHIATHVPEEWQDGAYRSAVDVLSTHRTQRKTFGVEVVAKLFRCSPRHIRSLKK